MSAFWWKVRYAFRMLTHRVPLRVAWYCAGSAIAEGYHLEGLADDPSGQYQPQALRPLTPEKP